MAKKIFTFTNVLLLCIVVFAAFLIFYKIQPTLPFNGEMGYDYMTIRTFVENHQIPLIGPRTSHEWLSLGPIFYWVFGILMPLFKYNVAVSAYFFAIMGVASVFVCYRTVKSLFGQRVGLISAFILSFSPLWVGLSKDARYNAPAALLFFPFWYYLVKSLKDKGKSLFLVGLILGTMFSFFPSITVLLPGAAVVIFIYRKRVSKKYFLPGILGLIIPNITFIIYNATHKFEILVNLFSWIPYRVLGFVGLYPKNTATPNILQSNLTGLYTFFQQSYFPHSNVFIFVLSLSVIVFAIIKHRKNLSLTVLLIISAVSYLGLFLHGDPPPHYYLVIFPVPIILLGLLLENFSKKYLWVTVFVLVYLLIGNLKFYFSDRWFYIDTVRMNYATDFVPIGLQEKIANFIAQDAGSKTFALARIGPYDTFEENYALNYHFLLWGLGHKPDQTSKLIYTIYEDTTNLPKNVKVHWIENIAISKNV